MTDRRQGRQACGRVRRRGDRGPRQAL